MNPPLVHNFATFRLRHRTGPSRAALRAAARDCAGWPTSGFTSLQGFWNWSPAGLGPIKVCRWQGKIFYLRQCTPPMHGIGKRGQKWVAYWSDTMDLITQEIFIAQKGVNT